MDDDFQNEGYTIMSKPHHQKATSLKTKIMSSFVLFVFLSSVIIGGISYTVAKNSIVHVIGNTSLSIVQSVVRIVDVEKFQKLQNPDDMSSEYYIQLQAQLHGIITETGVKYLYTMRHTSDGKFFYVVDGTAQESDNFSPRGTEETNITKELAETAAGQPAYTFSADAWGPLITAYVPITDQTGTVMGILAADFDAANMVHQLNMLTIAIVSIVAAVIALSFIAGNLISNYIVKPIKRLTEAADKLADGDINIEFETTLKDELGCLMHAFSKMVENIRKQSHLVQLIADRDLTATVDCTSDKDVLSANLKKMTQQYNAVLTDIGSTATNLVAQSEAFSDSSKRLSTGAMEQASHLADLSSSIDLISTQISVSTQNAEKANDITRTVKVSADKGNHSVQNMLTSMNEVDGAAKNISKIISVIDDIAFQTNILALNAAVEAARAGNAGKGFAVVAEEVRNLASKSARAAKETSSLIEESITKIKLGSKTAGETAVAFEEIYAHVDNSLEFMDRIHSASQEQSAAIATVRTGIQSVSQIVHENTATAEESAAVSEVLLNYADHLNRTLHSFTINNTPRS